MPSQSTESVMNRFVEFINTGDEDLAREVISPDAVFHAPSHPEPLRGPDGYLAVRRGGGGQRPAPTVVRPPLDAGSPWLPCPNGRWI